MKCPYANCPFEGTQKEVDDHVTYMISVGDKDHDSDDKLRF